MIIDLLGIAGAFTFTVPRHGDTRGWFSVPWNEQAFNDAAGGPVNFCQDNHVYTADRGVLRGLHFQAPPFAQAKLVRCTAGCILDVIVDIRTGSPDYGHHVGVLLDAEEGRQIFVPRGFAHGYVTLSENCEVLYKVDNQYAPDAEGGLNFADTALSIDWQIPADGIQVNDRDRSYPGLADFVSPFQYGDNF